MTKKERRAAYVREYNAKPENKQRQAARAAKWHANNRAKVNQRHADYRSKPENKKRAIELERLRKYDLLPVEYNFMLAGQGFRCAACGADDPGGRGEWHVDHCHDTGMVRGILCQRCNMGIGLLGDTAERLRAAADYLERAECKTNNSTTPTSEMDGPSTRSPHTEPNAKPQAGWSAGLL